MLPSFGFGLGVSIIFGEAIDNLSPSGTSCLEPSLPIVSLCGVPLHAITERQCIQHVLNNLDEGHGGWIVTANLDFLQHYRPTENVIRRPVRKSGRGIALTGHHEIMIPLLAAWLVELSSGSGSGA